METIKHALKNRMIAGCIVIIVIFVCLSYICDKKRDKAEGRLNQFVALNSLTIEMIRKNTHLRVGDSVASGNGATTADLERGMELWDAYRQYDYWLSIFKTFVLIAVVLIMMRVLKSVLANIYVPKSIYRKFYLPPDQDDIGSEKNKKK